MTRFLVMTAPAPGAIAVIQLLAPPDDLLASLTGRPDWPTGRARLASLGDLDRGVVARVEAEVVEVMPHGGPRVVQRLVGWLEVRGAIQLTGRDAAPRDLYPEARDDPEALALAAVARAASPLAIDLLLDQPRRWRGRPTLHEADRARSARLDRLLDPPLVVLAGPPNVGKSTLANALAGRELSIALDRPGTTRDYTTGRIDLAGLVVEWHDTPGLRRSDDPLEDEAIARSLRLVERADLLLAMTDAEHEWPGLPREPDLRVAGKADLGRRNDADVAVSALTGEGVEALVTRARDRLVPPEDLRHAGPWLFDPRLEG